MSLAAKSAISEKIEAVAETTIVKNDSDVDMKPELPSPAGFKTHTVQTSAGSNIKPGPEWVYGTATANKHITKSGSGLLLANKGGHIALASPEVIQNYLYPISPLLQNKILNYRNELSRLLNFDLTCEPMDHFDNPLLVVTGPSFIKTSNQLKACCQWVGSLLGKKFNKSPGQTRLMPENVASLYDNPLKPKHLKLSLRTNLTSYNLPYADFNEFQHIEESNSSIMTYEVAQGMPFCRALLDEISEICPIVGETSDTITPQYLSDLFCLALVSSTLVESQLHRELTSGVSYPVGFNTSDSHLPFDKSMYKHKVQSALDAMYASHQEHQFLSVNKLGMVTVVGTAGNDETFIILQLNLDLSFDELKALIKTIYDHPKLHFKTPKIMLDVGKLSNSNYEKKLSLLQQFLTEDDQYLKYKIAGVLIDSGDDYVPDNYKVDLDHQVQDIPINFDANPSRGRSTVTSSSSFHRNFEDMNRYFERNRMSAKPELQEENQGENYYEYFINANKLIAELDELSYQRKTNV